MAWPDNLNHVYCSGFDKKHLPIIKQAIEDKNITWGEVSLFASACSAKFVWSGRTWQLEESFETVTSIILISTKPKMTDEDFTAAVLKGR